MRRISIWTVPLARFLRNGPASGGRSAGSWWGGWWGNTGTSLQLSTSNSSTVTFSGNKLKVGSYYLRYSNGSVNLNSSATTAYVFVEG